MSSEVFLLESCVLGSSAFFVRPVCAPTEHSHCVLSLVVFPLPVSNAASNSKFDTFESTFCNGCLEPWPRGRREGCWGSVTLHQASLADSTRPVSLADDDQAGHDQAARVLLPAFSADGTKQYYAHRSCAGSLPKEQVSQSTYTPFSARTPWQSLAVLRTGSPTSAPCRVECDPVPHVIPDGRKRACTGVQMPSSSSAPLLWKPSGTTSRGSFHEGHDHKAGVYEPSGNAPAHQNVAFSVFGAVGRDGRLEFMRQSVRIPMSETFKESMYHEGLRSSASNLF